MPWSGSASVRQRSRRPRRGSYGWLVEPLGAGVGLVCGVEKFAVDVELVLAPGVVAGTDRCAAPPSREVGKGAFAEVSFTADAVHHLEVDAAVQLGGGRGGQEPEVGAFSLVTGRCPQGLEGEAGVTDPGVAVVPVAVCRRALREGRGGGCNDGAGGCEGQCLQHASAVGNLVLPRAAVILVYPGPAGPPWTVSSSRRPISSWLQNTGAPPPPDLESRTCEWRAMPATSRRRGG